MLSDEDLIQRVLARDAAGFEQLMRLYRDGLLAQIVRIVRDPAAGEDIVQEVFLRVWTRAEQWNGDGSLRGWISRIGVNLALNHLRSAKRRPAAPLVHPQEDRADDLEDVAARPPHELLEDVEQRGAVRRMLAELSPAQRDIVSLVYEDELDMAEAALRLGIPTGTAKSRLHYAIKRLARQWNEQDPKER